MLAARARDNTQMAQAQTEFDVVIVGAGPAGAAAGIELRRAGRSVLALDRARFPRPKTCGDALSNRAVRIVVDLGAGARLDAAPHTLVTGSAACFSDGTRIERSYATPGMIVGRTDLDDALRRTLEETGAVVREGVAAKSLLVEGGVVRGVECEGGVTFRARCVIAADGYGSIARERLGARERRGRALAISSTAYFEGVAPLGRAGFAEHWLDPDLPCGYGWIFPPVAGVSNVGVYLRADAYEARGERLSRLLERFLERQAARFSGARRLGPVRTWSLPLAGALRRWGGAGLLAVGDAASAIDPLTGEGIWQALHTGRLAGRAAAAALRDGEVTDATARRYSLACARTIDAPSRVRALIQDALRVVVDRGLHRVAPVRGLLDWGFGSGASELTKSV